MVLCWCIHTHGTRSKKTTYNLPYLASVLYVDGVGEWLPTLHLVKASLRPGEEWVGGEDSSSFWRPVTLLSPTTVNTADLRRRAHSLCSRKGEFPGSGINLGRRAEQSKFLSRHTFHGREGSVRALFASALEEADGIRIMSITATTGVIVSAAPACLQTPQMFLYIECLIQVFYWHNARLM